MVVCGLVAIGAQSAFAATVYGVTEANALVRFETSTPGTVTSIGAITGLLGGEQILAIDFRPETGRLYGVSASHLYVIDTGTAQAGLVSPTAFSVVLVGNVAMDFDPVSGAIRVVTDTNQNLRINAVTGVVTADTNTSASGIVAAAFTNNFASPDRATLFGINASTDQLVRIGGVDLTDNGASQAGGAVTAIGPLGSNIDTFAGLDIAANDNTAWASLAAAADTQSTLYTVNLQTGAATSVGLIAAGGRLRGLALPSRAITLYGLTSSNAIVTFLSAVPGTLLPLGSGAPVPVLGLDSGENLLAIDTRPATGGVYGITSTGRLLIVNPATGQTSVVGTSTVALSGVPVGFDFNPTVDRVRVTTDTGQNFILDPTNAAATSQTNLSVATTVALAYTNNVINAGSTQLYGIDAAADQLLLFATPASGVATPLTPIGTNAGQLTSFEIAAADGTGYAAITAPSGTETTLYTVSLPDGTFRPVGVIGGGTTIRGLAAAAPGIVHLSSTTYSTLENGTVALISLQREFGSSGPINVKLTAAPGTASGADFVAGTTIVEFADGEVSKTVNIVITDDGADEPDETATLTLSEPGLGAALGAPVNATLTIVDNDPTVGVVPQVTIMSPTSASTYTASSLFLTLAGSAADSDGTIQSVAWTNDRGFNGTASTGGAAANLDWIANDVPLAPGVNTITVTARDNNDNLAQDTIVVTVTELSYFLAEGATGGFFDLDLLLANPNTTPVNITATYLKPGGGGTIVQHYTLPATSRTTINVEAIAGLEQAEVSTIVTAPAATPILVERTMRWDTNGYGAHTDKASPNTSLKWFFAEGSQGFFFTYLLLANPANAPNQVTVNYLREGATPVTRTYNLNPLERFTVDIGADTALQNTSFGMEVTFTLPGIAERAMYFGLNPLWIGGHESVGVTLPSRDWFLAEGATGPFFETFVLFANPSTAPAEVDVRYLPSLGTPVDKTYTVPAQARLTVNIETEDPSLVNAAVATQVTSNVPILVERAQYWPDPAPSWYEAHNSFGLTSLGTRWGLAEGRVGGTSEYSTYILLANPGTTAADVSIDFLRSNGTTLTKTYTVQPTSRFNVQVGGPEVPEITNDTFGAVITSSQPIAVERAMYANATGPVWQAGTNATGTRLPTVVP